MHSSLESIKEFYNLLTISLNRCKSIYFLERGTLHIEDWYSTFTVISIPTNILPHLFEENCNSSSEKKILSRKHRRIRK